MFLEMRGYFLRRLHGLWVDGDMSDQNEKIDLSKITVDLVVSIEKKRPKL